MSFAVPAMLAVYERELALPGVVFAGDEDRALYAALGFGRASLARVWLHPRVVAAYARLIARGRRPRRPVQDDVQQLGGDAVLSREGRVCWVYTSRGPEDRPSFDAVRRAVAQALGSPASAAGAAAQAPGSGAPTAEWSGAW